jgi:hypothetical protein
MAKWEYALLVRRRTARLNEAGWEITFTWYGPDGSMLDVTPVGDTALTHLNHAGLQSWELVAVTEDPSMPGTSELHRYHMKRPIPTALPRQRAFPSSRARR